jgi:hypothetical protein
MHNTQKTIGVMVGLVVLFGVGLAFFPEPAAVTETPPSASGSEPAPPPVAYTDQQIFDTRDQGTNRPECVGVRARAMQLPTWMRSGLPVVFGCASAVETQIWEMEKQQQIQQLQLQQQQWQLQQQQRMEMIPSYEYPDYPDMELP